MRFLVLLSCVLALAFAKDSWWQHTTVYQIYPRSYQDSDGDGTGDLKGIESRLDYIKDLGVETIWLSPIFKSPMKDFGYDISDFIDIDPIFGSLEDFIDLLDQAHLRNMKIILDFVPNHSSDEHEWFLKSVAREEPYTDFYVWADPKAINDEGQPLPPNNWVNYYWLLTGVVPSGMNHHRIDFICNRWAYFAAPLGNGTNKDNNSIFINLYLDNQIWTIEIPKFSRPWMMLLLFG